MKYIFELKNKYRELFLLIHITGVIVNIVYILSRLRTNVLIVTGKKRQEMRCSHKKNHGGKKHRGFNINLMLSLN